MKEIQKDEYGRLCYADGDLVNTRDYLLTKPYIPRYYDFTTKNTSAIQLHILLKKLGLKNNKEHLQIFDQGLIGIDPWDPLLPDAIKMRIVNECRRNYWYVYREILKVNNNTEPFDLNIGNYTAIYMMLRNQSFFYEAARQLGKTEVIAAQIAIEFNFERNLEMANVHYDSVMAAKNMEKISDRLKGFPNYLKFYDKILGKTDKKTGKVQVTSKSRSAARKESLKAEAFNNLITTFVVGQDSKKANTTGRGTTIGLWFLDEIPHIKFNDIAFGAFNQATKTASKVSKRNNKPFGIRMLGTPGDLKTAEGTWMFDNITRNYTNLNENTLDVLDLTEDEINEWNAVRNLESNIFHIKFDFDKVGMDSKWFNDRCKNEKVEGIRSELLLRWEEKGDNSPFPQQSLTNLANQVANTIEKEYIVENLEGEKKIKIYPKEGDIYTNWIDFLGLNYRNGLVIGIDVAYGGGLNSDSTALVFVDAIEARVVATLAFNDVDTNSQKVFICWLVENVLNAQAIRSVLAIERNSPGISMLDDLMILPQVQPYLMRYPVTGYRLSNPLAKVDFEYRDKNGLVKKYMYGYTTNSDTRDKLIKIIQQLVIKHTNAIAARDLAAEIKTMVYVKTKTKERAEAAPGKHDDLVMACAHAYHCIFNEADTLKYFGIEVDPDRWLINTNTDIFTTSNHKYSGRIVPYYEEVRGELIVKYFDTISRKYVDQEEADRLMKDEEERRKNKYNVNTNTQRDNDDIPLPEVRDQFDDRLTRYASSNVRVATAEETAFINRGIQMDQGSSNYDAMVGSLLNDLGLQNFY